MKLECILEYQEIDKQLKQLNRNLNYSAEAKAYAQARQMVTDAKEALIKLDRMAGELIANFDKNVELIQKNQELTKEFRRVVKDVKDLTEIDYYQRKLDECAADCTNVSRELNSIKDRIQYVKTKTNEAMRQGKEAQDKMVASKTAYDKLKEQMSPEADRLNKKMNELEKQICDATLIEKLDKLSKNNVTPMFVKCENTVCMGCGMNIANNLQSQLKDPEAYVECPNCGRILYSM